MDPRKRILIVGLLLLTAAIGGLVVFRPIPTPQSPLPVATTLSPVPAEIPSAPVTATPVAAPKETPIAPVVTADRAIATAAPFIDITSGEEEFFEQDGALSYKGNDYIMTADSSGVRAALLTNAPHEAVPTISLSLHEVRVGETLLPINASVLPGREAAASTLSFDRGSVLERVQCGKNSFEQDFIISELPPGRGAISVVQRIGTTLTAPADGTRGASLLFGTKESGAFEIAKAVAIDAAGRKVPLELSYSSGRMEMTVPASWVESARLPIVIDPVVGSAFTIYSPVNFYGDSRCFTVYGSGPNEWLVAWWDQVAVGVRYVYAQRVSAAGALVGSRITVTGSSFNGSFGVTYSSSLNQYMFAYDLYTPATATTRLAGRLLAANGTFPGSEFILTTLATDNYLDRISLACNGASTFLAIAKKDIANAPPAPKINGYLFSNTGTLLAQPVPQPTSTGSPSYPKVAYSNSEFLAVWKEGTSVMARGMNTSGALLTGITTVATGSAPWNEVSSGNNQFLVTWYNSTATAVLGRVVQANSAATLAFATSAFNISTTAPGVAFPHASYSSTNTQWFVAHHVTISGALSIAANLVSPSGSSGADQAVVPVSVEYPRTAWNSATNEVLVVYEKLPFPNLILQAIRFGLGSTPPSAPMNLVATPGNQTVGLTWSAVSGATSYKIYSASTSGAFSTTPTATVSVPAYNHLGLNNGSHYYYVVVSSSTSGDSPRSNEADAIPLAPPPTIPSALIAVGLNARINLSWGSSSGATGYEIFRSSVVAGPYTPISTTTLTSWTDSLVTNGIAYSYCVAAFNAGGLSPVSNLASATPSSPASIPALFVVGNTTLNAGDTAIRNRLNTLGYGVTSISGAASATTNVNGKAIVIISSTVTSADVNSKFKDVTVPVVVCESAIMDDMKMTAGVSGTDYGTQTSQQTASMIAASSTHPLAAGLTGAPQICTVAATLSWGKPASSAISVATVAGANSKICVYGYDTSSTMVGMTAPARRVGFFLEDATASVLTTNGWLLFEAAVRWASGAPGTPVVEAIASKGMVTVTWGPVPGAFSYTVRRGSSSSTLIPIATGISVTRFEDTGVTDGQQYYYDVIAFNDTGSSALMVPLLAGPVANPLPAFSVITGPNVLRHLPGNANWSTGNYTLETWYLENGIMKQPVAPKTTQVNWTLRPLTTKAAVLPGAVPLAPSNATATMTNRTSTGVTLTASGVQGSTELSADISIFNGDGSLFAKGTSMAEVLFTKRKVLRILIRFPEDLPNSDDIAHRTQRKDRNGQPNKFFDEDPFIRETARRDYAALLAEQLEQYWKPAGILPYVNADLSWRQEDTDISDSYFDPTTNALITDPVIGDSVVYPLGSFRLRIHNSPGIINIWLLRKLQSSQDPEGATLVFGDEGGRTISVQDPQDLGIGADTIAHELGHAMRLEDIQDNPFDAVDQGGWINNRLHVELPNLILHRMYFLMWMDLGALDLKLSRDNVVESRKAGQADGNFGGQNEDP